MSFKVPAEAAAILAAAPSVTVARSVDELVKLAVRDERHGWHEVAYDVPGKGRVAEARVSFECRLTQLIQLQGADGRAILGSALRS